MAKTAALRDIFPGFERLPATHVAPRHAHLSAYVTVVLDGGYEQASYAGRLKLAAGDVVVQPTLDRHACWMGPGRDLDLLRLPWRFDAGFGGVHRPAGLDEVIRTARIDPRAAAGLLAERLGEPIPRRLADWPDLLASELALGGRIRLADWAAGCGLARETVSRGFAQAFAVSPRRFGAELKARRAWCRVMAAHDGLAAIAADEGFADQPHMTRAIAALTGAPPQAWRRRAAAT